MTTADLYIAENFRMKEVANKPAFMFFAGPELVAIDVHREVKDFQMSKRLANISKTFKCQ